MLLLKLFVCFVWDHLISLIIIMMISKSDSRIDNFLHPSIQQILHSTPNLLYSSTSRRSRRERKKAKTENWEKFFSFVSRVSVGRSLQLCGWVGGNQDGNEWRMMEESISNSINLLYLIL